MFSLEIIPAVSQPPVEEASAAQPEIAYSIKFFFAWHKQALLDICNWCARNWVPILTGVVGFVVTIALCIGLLFLLRKIIVPLVDKKSPGAAKEIMAISAPVMWLILWFGFSVSIDFIPFPAETHAMIDKFFYVCFALTCLSIFRHALQCAASQMIVHFKQKNPENYNMNKLMLDLSQSIVRLVVWIFVILFILQDVFCFKVTHLIASAGILGLGIAFAAKDTIANIFGAFAILGSKMFRVGDWIKAGATQGIVEQIGFRSIQVRAFEDGRVIDIPNHIIADSQIENFSKRLFWREHFCFGLVYQTTPEEMALAKKILAEIGNDLADLMAKDHPVLFDFILFDQCSLNLDGFVWFKASDWATMRHARSRFNEEVLKRFREAHLELAFPTTTVFLEQEEKK